MVDIQIYHLAFWHIVHAKFRGQICGYLIAELGLVIAVGNEIPGAGLTETKEICFFIQFELIRLFGKPPGGIAPAPDGFDTAFIESVSGLVK